MATPTHRADQNPAQSPRAAQPAAQHPLVPMPAVGGRGHTWRGEPPRVGPAWPVSSQQTAGKKPPLSPECRDGAGTPGRSLFVRLARHVTHRCPAGSVTGSVTAKVGAAVGSALLGRGLCPRHPLLPDLRGPDQLPARIWEFPLLVIFIVLLIIKVAHSSKF